MADSNSKIQELLLREVEHVRNEYDEAIRQTRLLERYAVLVTGLIWSWCVTNPGQAGVDVLIWFPAILTAVFGIRAWSLHCRALAARRYIAEVEPTFSPPKDLGWAQKQINRKFGTHGLVACTAYLFWGVVQVGTIVVPIMYG